MMPRSPFSDHRWEHDEQHLFYLRPDMLSLLERPKSLYLSGSRGTGKTTLLKALDWGTRISNESLARYLPESRLDSEGGPFIGLYLRLPEIQLALLEHWLSQQDPYQRDALFSVYLDLVWSQELVHALVELIAQDQIEVDICAEEAVVKGIFKQYPGVTAQFSETKGRTLLDLQESLREGRKRLERGAVLREEPTAVLTELGDVTTVGVIGSEIAVRLLSLLPETWYLKICIDEGEYLSEYQLRVFNTLIRRSRFPVFWVVSFLGRPRTAETLSAGVFLQESDRAFVDLTFHFRRQRFRDFAEGVFHTRLSHHFKLDPEWVGEPSLEDLFGPIDINRALNDLLKDSVSPRAKEILARAEEVSGHTFFKHHFKHSGKKSGVRPFEKPIYEAYLVDMLDIDLVTTSSSKERRRQASAELRKRMVAAYLSICREIRTSPKYHSVDVVLGCSDGCIQDFLRFLDRMFVLSASTADDFVRSRVPTDTQHEALMQVSKQKERGLPISGLLSPREGSYLVRGLGKLTALVQSQSPDKAHLRSSERGRFSLPLGDGHLEHSSIPDILGEVLDAAEQGHLKLLKLSAERVSFRVHGSLAPAFGFSYRGSYYSYPVQWDHVIRMRRASDPESLESLTRDIASRSLGHPRHQRLELFE